MGNGDGIIFHLGMAELKERGEVFVLDRELSTTGRET